MQSAKIALQLDGQRYKKQRVMSIFYVIKGNFAAGKKVVRGKG